MTDDNVDDDRLIRKRRDKSKEDECIIRLALKRSPYFSSLDEEQIHLFVAAAQLRKYAPGEIVLLEGEDDDAKETSRVIANDDSVEPEVDVAANHPKERPSREGSAEEEIFEDGEAYVTLDAAEASVDDAKEDDPTDQFVMVEGVEGVVDTEAAAAAIVEPDDDVMPSDELLTNEEGSRFVYIVRSGSADAWHVNVKTASLGPSTTFGEGGFFFHRPNSASILASDSEGLQCWMVPSAAFRQHILPSQEKIQLFEKFAKGVDEDYRPFMTMDDFVDCCNAAKDDPNVHLRLSNTYNILHQTASTQKMSLADFCIFHLLMAMPDPEVDVAFLMFDQEERGTIVLEDVQKFLDAQRQPRLERDCDFVKRHFGNDGDRSLHARSFSQFLADFHQEMGRQAFRHELEASDTNDGCLPSQDFVRILTTACGWRLPQGLSERLYNLYSEKNSVESATGQLAPASVLTHVEGRPLRDNGFAYGDFLAFQEVLKRLPGICNLIHGACKIKNGPISPEDFKVVSRVVGFGGTLSRRQGEIVFELFDLDQDGFISTEDFASVVGDDFVYRLKAIVDHAGQLKFAPPPINTAGNLNAKDTRDTLDRLERLDEDLVEYTTNYAGHLGIGAAAGAFGALAGLLLAPVDLVKTRLQQQRIRPDGVRMYKNAWDCLTRAYRTEGLFNIFRGNIPYVMSIIPQRAFQLTVYEQICGSFAAVSERTGETVVSVPVQAMAGGVAGACQVFFANPLELAKIELQTQGETARLFKARGQKLPPIPSFVHIATELAKGGFLQGAASCLWRDIPFSAMFFPCYTYLKQALNTMDSSKAISNAFMAGSAAAIPAAMLVTPADVIKTRLQAPPREITYSGLRHCATHMYKHEGLGAFFVGAGLRALRIAPQMGLTMAAYEALPGLLKLQQASSSDSGSKKVIVMTRATMRPLDSFETSDQNKSRQQKKSSKLNAKPQKEVKAGDDYQE